jgi:tetratricopeptide (TPR) repeat protein
MLELKPENRPSAESLGNRLDELFNALVCSSPSHSSVATRHSGFFVEAQNVLGTSVPSTKSGLRWEQIFASGNLGQHMRTLDRYLLLAKRRKRVLGSQDPNTIWTCLCYAWGSFFLGFVDQALNAFQEVGEIQRTMFNDEHPELWITMNGIAWTYVAQRRDYECSALFRQILGVQRRVLGSDHPQTLDTMFGLATSLCNLGDGSAIEIFEQTIHRQSLKLGADHVSTLISKAGLAWAYVRFREKQDALRLYEEAATLLTKLLGLEHIDTLDTLSGLAWVLMLMGESKRAVQIFEGVATRQTRLLGIDDSCTLFTFKGLERAYGKKRALQFRRKLEISEHRVSRRNNK